MKTRYFKKSHVVFTLLLLSLAFNACKKNKVAPPDDGKSPVEDSRLTQTPTTNRRELTNDSLFLYAKEIYFWNESLPTYDAFNPRKYTSSGSDLANYNSNLFNIVKSSNSPDYVSTSSSPKYSRIEVVANKNPQAGIVLPDALASVDLEGNGNDLGIYGVSAVSGDNTTYKLYILAVSQNSPADKASLTRGSYITRINGTSLGSVANFNAEQNVYFPLIYGNSSSLALEGVRTDGSSFSVTLNKTIYKSSPVYKTNVLTAGNKKIGYLAYARFSSAANSDAALQAAFDNFVAKGVTDLVIDLRYNGGGYVNTAEEMVNYIAPSSAKGTMYVEYYNKTLQNRKISDRSILSNQPLLDENNKIRYTTGTNPRMLTYADLDYSVAGNTRSFSKLGGLTGIQNVVFIVTGNTASASELVINSLKPKMNVKLVGKTTYGKPIGFFPVRLENKYDVLYSLFETRNALGEGQYYTGFVPDVDGGIDFGNYDFGNPLDGYLAKAVAILAPNVSVSAISSINRVMSESAGQGNPVNNKVLGAETDNTKEFVGMIETRHTIK